MKTIKSDSDDIVNIEKSVKTSIQAMNEITVSSFPQNLKMGVETEQYILPEDIITSEPIEAHTEFILPDNMDNKIESKVDVPVNMVSENYQLSSSVVNTEAPPLDNESCSSVTTSRSENVIPRFTIYQDYPSETEDSLAVDGIATDEEESVEEMVDDISGNEDMVNDVITNYETEDMITTEIRSIPTPKRFNSEKPCHELGINGSSEFYNEINSETEKLVGKHYTSRKAQVPLICMKDGTKNVFMCSECKKTFARESYLKKHAKTHNREKCYKCDQCSEAFSLKSSLVKHLRSHSEETGFKCVHCKQSFVDKYNLFLHMKTHDGKPHKCSYCGKAFTSKLNMKQHMWTHTGEKPYKCSHCDHTFVRKQNLVSHIKTHTGEKPFQCNFCEYSFSHKQDLINHLRTHTGEKPHHCNHCGNAFAQKQTLINHVRIHTGERPYECQNCGKTFNRKSTLETHTLTHTGEKPFKCIQCGKAFTYKVGLNKHIRMHEMPNECEEKYSENLV